MLPANAHFQLGVGRPALSHPGGDKEAHPLYIERLKRVFRKDPLVKIVGQERTDIVPREPDLGQDCFGGGGPSVARLED